MRPVIIGHKIDGLVAETTHHVCRLALASVSQTITERGFGIHDSVDLLDGRVYGVLDAAKSYLVIKPYNISTRTVRPTAAVSHFSAKLQGRFDTTFFVT